VHVTCAGRIGRLAPALPVLVGSARNYTRRCHHRVALSTLSLIKNPPIVDRIATAISVHQRNR
jgi:hypothetical protein